MRHVFPHVKPFRYGESGGQVKWPKEVEKAILELNQAVGKAEEQKINYLRAKAIELGFAATELKDLRSEKGRSFEEREKVPHRWGELRKAHEVLESGEDTYKQEWAYFCGFTDSFGKQEKIHIGCGWVRGWPKDQEYDDIGVLSGSAGIRFSCQICGMKVGEDQQMVS